MAPAPMAMTTRAAAIGVLKPSTCIIDPVSLKAPMMLAVVVIATVDEPWADLSTAAMMNGKNTPNMVTPPAHDLMMSTKQSAEISAVPALWAFPMQHILLSTAEATR